MGQRLTFQQDNEPTREATSTVEWLKTKNTLGLEWPSQRPDQYLIENLF